MYIIQIIHTYYYPPCKNNGNEVHPLFVENVMVFARAETSTSMIVGVRSQADLGVCEYCQLPSAAQKGLGNGFQVPSAIQYNISCTLYL